MPSVTIDAIERQPDGRILVRTGKRAAVRASLNRDDLLDIALALVLARQPNLGNPAAFAGRTVTVDFSQVNWGTVS